MWLEVTIRVLFQIAVKWSNGEVTSDADALVRGCETSGSSAPTNTYDANTGSGTAVTTCNNAVLCNSGLIDTAASKLLEITISKVTATVLFYRIT